MNYDRNNRSNSNENRNSRYPSSNSSSNYKPAFKSNYNSNDRDSGLRGNSSGRDSEWRDKFDTVCDNCGRDCQVPFKPVQGKPVYCDSCFGKMKDRESNQEPRRFDDRDSRDRVPRERSFERNETKPVNTDNTKIMEQLVSLNIRLEKIAKLLEAQTQSQPTPKKEVVGKVEDEVKIEKPKRVKKAKAN